MKTLSMFASVFFPAVVAWTQDTIPTEIQQPQTFSRSNEVLEELVAPVALHPDALIALILPASTTPSEIVLAGRFLESNGNLEQLDEQPWTDSVRALARYPDVVRQMDDDLEWTIELGQAFLDQPAEVMEAIQRLRARAKANGTLASTDQQTVTVEKQHILIVPTQPDVIYVPTYDTRVVYVDRPVYYGSPYITFGVGFAVGPWMTYDCDWYGRRVWYVNDGRYWRHNRDWRYPRFPSHSGYVHHTWRRPWNPPYQHFRPRNPHPVGRPPVASPPRQSPPREHAAPRPPSDPRWVDSERRRSPVERRRGEYADNDRNREGDRENRPDGRNRERSPDVRSNPGSPGLEPRQPAPNRRQPTPVIEQPSLPRRSSPPPVEVVEMPRPRREHAAPIPPTRRQPAPVVVQPSVPRRSSPPPPVQVVEAPRPRTSTPPRREQAAPPPPRRTETAYTPPPAMDRNTRANPPQPSRSRSERPSPPSGRMGGDRSGRGR